MLRNTFISATLIMLLGVSSTAQAIVPAGNLMGTTSVTFTGVEETKHSSTLTIALDPAKPAIEEITDEQIDNSVTVTYTITSRANGPDDYTLAVPPTTQLVGIDSEAVVGAALTTNILDAGDRLITWPINLGATAAISNDGPTVTVPYDGAEDGVINGIHPKAIVVINNKPYEVIDLTDTAKTSTLTLNQDPGVLLSLGTPIAEREKFKVVVSGDALLNPAENVTFTLNVIAGNATQPDNADLTHTVTLTYDIDGVEILPSSERYARNLTDPTSNPTDTEVESTEYDSGGDSQWFFKTGVSAKQGDEVEILIVMNAGNQKDQTDIILKETLSPFVKFVSGSYTINNTPLTAEMNAFISRRSENARWLKSWHVTDPDGATPLTIPKNGKATITYKVKVIGGVGDKSKDSGNEQAGRLGNKYRGIWEGGKTDGWEPSLAVYLSKPGTPWRDGSTILVGDSACWCEGPGAPAEYCVEEGWAVGRNGRRDPPISQGTIREYADKWWSEGGFGGKEGGVVGAWRRTENTCR